MVNVFCNHLAYMPAVRSFEQASRGHGGWETIRPMPPSTAPPMCSFPATTRRRSKGCGSVPESAEARKSDSLQQLLLRWFGVEAI